MASSPLVVLSIVFLTLAFEGLVFGGEIASQSFPKPEEAPASCGEGDDALSRIANCITSVVYGIVNTAKVIFGVVAFLFNLITFNVPGAPAYIRFPVGGIIVVGIVWSVAGLIRGN